MPSPLVKVWPDAEHLARDWVREHRPELADAVYSRDARDGPPTRVVITRTGGGANDVDREVDVEVTAIAATREDCWALARDLEGLMWALATSGNAHGYVDEVRELFGFAEDPSDNDDAWRASATFTLIVRPLPGGP